MGKKIALLLLLSFIPQPLLAETKILSEKINFVTLQWPPYVYKRDMQDGIFLKILTEALALQNINSTISFRPWVRALKEGKSGEYHAIFPAYYGKEREDDFLFSRPIMSGPIGFYKKVGTDLFYDGTIKSMQQYKIGLVRGYINPPLIDRAPNLKKDHAGSDEENLRKLCAGRVELIVIDFYVAKYLMQENAKKGEICQDLEPIGKPLESKDLYVMVSKKIPGAKEIIEKIDSAVEKFKKSERYLELIK